LGRVKDCGGGGVGSFRQLGARCHSRARKDHERKGGKVIQSERQKGKGPKRAALLW